MIPLYQKVKTWFQMPDIKNCSDEADPATASNLKIPAEAEASFAGGKKWAFMGHLSAGMLGHLQKKGAGPAQSRAGGHKNQRQNAIPDAFAGLRPADGRTG